MVGKIIPIPRVEIAIPTMWMGRINRVLIHPMPQPIRLRRLLHREEIQIMNIKAYPSSEMIAILSRPTIMEILPPDLLSVVAHPEGVEVQRVDLGNS